jgi:hypothetical protein
MDNTSRSTRLRTLGAAGYLGLSKSTLEKDRCEGRLNIPYIKAGKAVLYDTADLDCWLAARRRTNTSEAA